MEIFNSSDVLILERGTGGEPTPGSQFQLKKIASVAISGHRVVVLNAEGKAEYASNANPAHLGRIVGLTLNAASQGGVLTIQNYSDVTEPSWNWNVTLPVFLGKDGHLTQLPPDPIDSSFSTAIGFPVSPNVLFVDIGPSISIT